MPLPEQWIFISYARADIAFARELREWLLEHDHQPWMDLFDIPAGARWPDEIDTALQSSGIVIGVMTPSSLASINVKNEWDWAIANHRRFILLMAEPCNVPFHYVSINFVDFIEDKEAGFRTLAAALDTPSHRDRSEPISSPRSSSGATDDQSAPLRDFRARAAARRRRELPIMVGRERERVQLEHFLSDAIAGRGSLVLIGGEAGVGKTTLVDELMFQAEQRECLVLSGGCYDLSTTPPYGPWVELLQSYSPKENRPLLPAWFGDLDLLERIGSQHALFEDTGQFFADVAQHQPVVIILEDLHWADPATVDALRYLARVLTDDRILIIVTYRDDEAEAGHPFFDAIPALLRETAASRIELKRWREADTREIIQKGYQLPPEDEARLTAYTYRLGEGNPFFTFEVLRMLEGDGVLRPTETGWALHDLPTTQVPPLVQQVIEHRLDGLSRNTRDALEIASIIGTTVPFELWLAVSHMESDVLADSVSEAADAHLAHELPDRSGIQFHHALIRQTFYTQVSGLQLPALHRMVAESLVDRSADADTIAHHFVAARDGRAAEWLIQAGLRAQKASAWITAADRFRQAEDLLADRDAEPQLRGWLLYYTSTLQRFTNDPLAPSLLDRAEKFADESKDRVLLAYIKGNRGTLNTIRGNVRQGIDYLQQCVELFESFETSYFAASNLQAPSIISELLSDIESPLAATSQRKETPGMSAVKIHPYHGVLANWLGMSGNSRRAHATGKDFHHRMVVAHGEDFHMHVDGSYSGYFGLGHSHAAFGRPELAQLAYRRARASAETFHDYVMMSYSVFLELLWVVIPYFTDNLDRRHRLAHYATDAWDQASEMASVAAGVMQSEILLDVLEGRWLQAEEEVKAEIERMGPLSTVGVLYFLRGYLARNTGRAALAWEQIQKRLPHGHRTKPGDSFFPEAIGLIRVAIELALDEEDLAVAHDWLEMHDRWLTWSGAVLGQAERQLLWACYYDLAGDPQRAREYVEHALENATEPRQPLALVAVHRFMGRLDVDEGYHGEAREHLQASLDLAEACHAPFERALTLLAVARLQLASGDHDGAGSLLTEIHATCNLLKALPTLERVAELEAQLEASYD